MTVYFAKINENDDISSKWRICRSNEDTRVSIQFFFRFIISRKVCIRTVINVVSLSPTRSRSNNRFLPSFKKTIEFVMRKRVYSRSTMLDRYDRVNHFYRDTLVCKFYVEIRWIRPRMYPERIHLVAKVVVH